MEWYHWFEKQVLGGSGAPGAAAGRASPSA